MLGTILHGARDVRCEEVPEPKILKPTDAIIRLVGLLHLRLRPLAVPWPERRQSADGDGPRILRHRRRGRQRGNNRPSGTVRRRLVLPVRQHLPALPLRLSVVVRAARVHDRRASAAGARPARRRHAGGHGGGACGRSDPEPAGDVGRVRHRLVRRRRCARAARLDGRRCRRRRGRPDGRACGEADGGRADHRHEPPQDSGRTSRWNMARPTSWLERGDAGVAQDQGADSQCRRGFRAGMRRHARSR